MNNHHRRGLESMRTRLDSTRDSGTPQGAFLRLASLELKATLCNQVKQAAEQRIREMNGKLGEIAAERTGLLRQLGIGEQDDLQRFAAPSCDSSGIRLKY